MAETKPAETPLAERVVERALFRSRWLMAPMYLGLALALLMLTVVFVKELVYYGPKVLSLTSEEAILVALTLIDLTLAANLLLIVMFSGYEAFVSRLDIGGHDDRPGWMGTVDFGGLKLKLIASIVAISGIHLLKRFMEIGQQAADSVYGDRELVWLTVIHVVFVISGVLMALMDFLTARAKRK